MPEVRELREATIRSKCEYFVDVQLWPIHERLDVEGWLRNFSPGDPHALHLLNGFMYYPDYLLNPMVMRALKQLSTEVSASISDYAAMKSAWARFLGQALVTFPTGEEPNPTDSGHDFARRAREIGLREDQILEPLEVVQRIAGGMKPSAVIFVDDFVGTGSQFRGTWSRSYDLGAAGSASFRSLHNATPFRVFYVPLFCTTLGEKELARDCPEVELRPLHTLGERYSALNPDGIVWPDALAATGEEFVERSSARAGIPDTGGAQPDDWRGFASLGLTLAFGRFVPDATLPLFYWRENGWQPLVLRH